MNVSAFLRGGPLTDVMWRVMNYRDFGDMLKDRQISKHKLDELIRMYKNKKIIITHLGHTKKLRALGPAASDNATVFEYDHNGTALRLTVDEYFSLRARTDSKYPILKYPNLPTVTVLTYYMRLHLSLVCYIARSTLALIPNRFTFLSSWFISKMASVSIPLTGTSLLKLLRKRLSSRMKGTARYADLSILNHRLLP